MAGRRLFPRGRVTEAIKRSHLWRIASGSYWHVISLPPKLWLPRFADAVAGLVLDLRHRTRTGGIVPVEQLELGERAPDAGSYQASSVRQLRKIVRRSGVRTADYAFVDLGCGKGRALAAAVDLGFRTVIGVELSRHLAREASGLARRLRNVHVVNEDAARYQFPEGPLFVFLYNPFSAKVLREVITHLPPCVVAYTNCLHQGEFSGFELVAQGRNRDTWAIYSSERRTPTSLNHN